MTAPTPTAPTASTARSVGPGRTRPVTAASPSLASGHGMRRTRRLPWVALGVLLTAGAVIAFALFTITQASRTLVWVTATDIGAGEVIERGDLTLVAVGADSGVRLVTRGQEGELLGSVARGPIPTGTLMSPALVVAPGESVPPGQSVVGASLEPGEYPSSRLAAGDRVRLVATVPPPTVPAADITGRFEAATDLGSALIWAVDAPSGSTTGTVFVSLLVPEESANLVVNAVSLGRLRLVLVSADG